MWIPLTCVLLLSANVLLLDEDVLARYQKFKGQHIIGEKNVRCDTEIQKRDISETNSNKCKETNTFIKATDSEIKSVCGNAGEPDGGLGVYWFRAGSHESHPSVIYAHGNSGDECEKSPEARSSHKCVYNFFKDDISSSDAGTYYCAVATCGQMLFGNGTKLDVEVGSTCDSQKGDTVLYLVCAALALSLVLVAFLLYAIRKKSCDCCDAVVTLQANAASASGDQQSQQRNEDSLVYSAPDFTRRKAGKSGRRSARKEETIYAEVRAFVMDP
ncbi:uncharacterized protein LOC121611254 [Chelmon rostratus]|uniref:uncharacterized protein LOC121611254 n=1 Tax=Chelmon rostratus TaxID=109905 RepID=UPI001BEA5229|nr:uncharacterized protein LOC121611254 [Chelmon rostratus]